MKDKITFLDFETTGFRENRAVSLGIVHYNKGRRVCENYYMINPMAQIEYRATKVHSITKRDVQNKPNFNDTWQEIKKYIEGCTLVAHNAQYDMKVLLGEIKRYNIECGELESVCTCMNAKKLKLPTENHKLVTLCEYYGISLNNHHNALDDTIACEKIFFHLCNEGKLISKMYS
ncbi:3'-5' exoribonuclease [Clostridium algoriphilum]|uniref:3'-5' exonuclease n=1 Tax=Clostridium algoriphilum TaxID=198347 RepID=UPI001CF36DCA|nr:exonuclease domain-containing protein [Clostridium algoriphilum]MCB2292653.1 3'-5' exoribonuclease [Clostridium algoriphilum]